MKDLFREDGHLTEEAIYGLSTEEIDELGRLEIAEHLSFCDDCILRYTLALEEEELLEVPTPQAPIVLNQIRATKRKGFLRQYATVAVAACFALALFSNGVFQVDRISRQSQAVTQLTSHVNSFTSEINQKLNSIVRGFDIRKEVGPYGN